MLGKVILDKSMSLDGFVAGPNDHAEQPLGVDGGVLHHWLFKGDTPSRHHDFFRMAESSRQVFDELYETTGALIVGRRTYDIVGGWGGSHPIHGIPVFVLTHEAPTHVPVGSTPFTFVTDDIHSAVDQALAAAGEWNVGIAGASVGKQCLEAGLLDEIHIHLVPVLLGNGIRLFDWGGSGPLMLESKEVIRSVGVTHLKYRVIKG